jgi:hypothetical protein
MNVLPATALSEPKLAGYLESWGWPDDTAVLDVDVECGGKWGAAWHRLMTFEEFGYGFVDDCTCGLHAPSRRAIPAAA